MTLNAESTISDLRARRHERLQDLYRSEVAPLQRLAFLLTHDHHAAEDITQQAFVKFYQRFFNLRDAAAAPAYLRRTVVNLAHGHHRRHRREREHLEKHASGGASATMPDVEDRDRVLRAIARLPYRQRAAVVLRFYGDLSEQQTAQALGCSPAAAKSLIARAMSSLRTMNLEGGANEH